jgi:predicted aspartyl protease
MIGIVDTGASVICLDKRVALRLGLTAVNRKPMEVADGTQIMATIYMAEMQIEGLGFRDWVEVFALPMTRPSSRVLLGRSFLKNYLVTYNGPEGLFHYFDPRSPYQGHIEELDG